MCRRVTCRTCGQPDWKGCGAHIEQVLGDVAPEDRCPRDHEAAASAGGSWLARLFGR